MGKIGIGEMVQCLKTVATLVENLGSMTGTHILSHHPP